ncbi:MAG TPA: NUDIX hydrolase [Henriciella marina]|uniref:NUDIX hydrolase n=1 Tax=Henriciella sp. TaxID=1968823 RepID=UPI001839E1C0|nr:NUDIX domain-containing protein [Henriciella sp.]HIG23479.1 NUDIX hydrolase [Henriciella sp.]HIK66214.1 NUDIX hydrolase [Henriciella marina]
MTDAAPRLSATVLLLRDAPDLQVLMVKRHYQIDFAAGALVFPGGKTNDEDASDEWDALSDGNYDGKARIARVAALREAFEESGIILARPAGARGEGAALVGVDVADKLAPFRESVDRREKSFVELVKEHDLVLALDTLVHFGHWITPDMMPKRFDTHFYLAPTPPQQLATHDGRETTDAVWLSPQLALDMEAAGEATIIFPTKMNLGKLAEAQSVPTAISRFRDGKVVTVLPVVGKDENGKPCLHIPAEAGYVQTIEPLEKVENVAKR